MAASAEGDAPRWYWILCLVVMLSSAVHVFRTRTPHDILLQSRPVAIAFGSIFLLFLAWVTFAVPPRPTFAEIARGMLPALFVLVAMQAGVAVASVFFYATGASFHDLYLWARGDLTGAPTASHVRLALATAIPVVVGVGLFAFRLRYRAVYGLSEAGVGLWIARQQISETSTDSPFFHLIVPILTASVYLMVRGFDNIHQGYAQDPVATTVSKWLTTRWKP